MRRPSPDGKVFCIMYKVLGDKTQEQSKIKSFTDLLAWQKAHVFAVKIYKVTANFPSQEQFGLTSQIRRAAVSVASNIAEGFSRSTKADKRHFYTIAQGSLTETQSQLLIARDVGYMNQKECQELAKDTTTIQKLLNGLIKALQSGKGVRNE